MYFQLIIKAVVWWQIQFHNRKTKYRWENSCFHNLFNVILKQLFLENLSSPSFDEKPISGFKNNSCFKQQELPLSRKSVLDFAACSIKGRHLFQGST